MSVPQRISDGVVSGRSRSPKRQHTQKRQRTSRRAHWRALGWELTGRLTLNLVLSLVALSSLVKLVPYYQTQRQVLQEAEASIATATQQNQRLRADFSRYFDPTQASQVIQENGARDSEQHVPIVLVDSLSPQAQPTAEE